MAALALTDTGFSTEDSFVQYLIDEAETIEEKSLGFYSQEGVRLSTFNKSTIEATAVLAKTNEDLYCVYELAEIVDGFSKGYNKDVKLGIFSAYDEAKGYFDGIAGGIPHPIKLAKSIKEEVGDPNLVIYVRTTAFSVSFCIRYKHMLVAEKLKTLTVQSVTEIIERFKKYEEELAQHGITITDLYKPIRRWGESHRFFRLEYEYKGQNFRKEVYIGSKFRHKERFLPDFSLLKT